MNTYTEKELRQQWSSFENQEMNFQDWLDLNGFVVLTQEHGRPTTYTKEEALVGNKPDMVNHPPHYTSHPSGVECIEVTEHYPFCIGNAIKYLWRAGLKGDAIEDLKKARWYLDREIDKRERESQE